MSGVDFHDDGPGPLPPPLQLGLRGSVGSGKTHDMIRVAKTALAANPKLRCVYSVTDLRLAAEAARRLQAELPGVPVAVWRGVSQPDPDAPGQTMCRRHEDVKALGEAGGEVADLCGSKQRGFCPFHPDAGGRCGYIAQGRTDNQVWVITHGMLGHPPPRALRRFTNDNTGKRRPAPAADLVLIDEAFHGAMLGGSISGAAHTADLADLLAPVFATVPDKADDLAPGHAARVVTKTLSDLHGVFTRVAEGTRVDSTVLKAAGMQGARCFEAMKYALRCKISLPAALPATPPGTVAKQLGAAAANNRLVLRVAKLLGIAADVLDGRLGPAALQVIKDKVGARRIALSWRNKVHKHWSKAPLGIIHGDATMQMDIVRRFLSELDAPDVPPIAAPHMRVVQVEDKNFGHTAILESKNVGPDGKKAAARRAQLLHRAICELAVRYRGQGEDGVDVLVVLPKELEQEFARAAVPLPANVRTLHFGKLRGQDAYKGVAALLVVSRVLPAPAVVEDIAEILFGCEVARLPQGAFYPKRDTLRLMQDGTARKAKAHFHPDARAEAVRRSCCEAELIQAIGRGRGIHRTAANPLHVFVLTDVPLSDVLVSDTCTLDEFFGDLAGQDPVLELWKAGVLPDNYPGIGAVLAKRGVAAKAKDPGEAARKWFGRNQDAKVALVSLWSDLPSANTGQSSYRNTLGGLSGIRASGPWARYTYRCAGSRKSGEVLVRPDHADPRAAVAAFLGPLTHFAPASNRPRLAPRAPKAPRAGSGLTRAARAVPVSGPAAPAQTPVDGAAGSVEPETVPLSSTSPARSPPASDTLCVGGNEQAATEAQIDATPVALPAVFAALARRGAVRPGDRDRHMRRFRMDRGSQNERERRALARLAAEIGMGALTAAVRDAARAKLGLP